MGYNTAVQVLRQAEDLKAKVQQKRDLFNDTEAWTNQQKLQDIYHQVLISDLEYALDKKVELDLWNIGFKSHISELQEKSRDKKNPNRSNTQALLTWALECASGFYLTLLQELCSAFDIDLPFRRRGTIYGQPTTQNDSVTLPQRASCNYICQYCLVHLGDIARYRNQRRQAENFYKQAIIVSPHSGHPYNQLALLEASQGDKLSTVFYYIRAVCVKNPFPASTTNLINVLNSCVDKESPLEKILSKMAVSEYIHLFLAAHGYFQNLTDLSQASLIVQSLNSVMTALVATQSFTRLELIKLTVINIYGLNQLTKEHELTCDELRVKTMILELIAGSLSAFLMPIYTIQTDDGLLDYYALPAVKLLTYYLQTNNVLFTSKVFKERMQIWPSLCKLVNAGQGLLVGFNCSKFSKCSLQEDRQLQGFIPLEQNLKDFNFKAEIDDVEIEGKVRLRRIIDFAKWLSECDMDGGQLITKSEDKGAFIFEPVLSQPDPTNELLEEMKSLKVDDKVSGLERKGGILKPQGSLEKSREEREVKEQTEVKNEVVKSKRTKQNVALQSIFKKMEESKQVKFNVASEEKKFNQPQTTYPYPPKELPPPPPPHPDYLTNLRNISNQPPKIPAYPPTFNVPPPQFNTWAREEVKVNPPNWWGQKQFPPNQRDFQFSSNYSFPQFGVPYKPPPNVGGYDLFNVPWRFGGDEQSMSMRQAMLKEATIPRMPSQGIMPPDLPPPNAGYSLFNSPWPPNLPNQMRSDNMAFNGPQHSLFGGPGPQSLAQLLEHQQNQMGHGGNQNN